MACGRDIWMSGGLSLPGRNPGNSHSRKAVACEAAENGVTSVTGRTMSANACSVFRRGTRIARLGESRPW